MKRTVFIFVIVISLLLRAGHAKKALPTGPVPEERETVSVSAAAEAVTGAPDREGLRQLLDGTLYLQPCCAGNSLRTAALLGGFYQWYAENAVHCEEAKRTALVWAGMRSPEERRKAASALRMLGKTTERMRAGDLDALLCDAGVILPEGLPDKEGFVCLTEDLSRLLLPEIFKNPMSIMNISR